MTPTERREQIEKIVNGGPATVNFLARSLHLPDDVSIIAKDLRLMSADGRVVLRRVRHAVLSAPEVRRWPRQIMLLVVFKGSRSRQQ